MTEQLTDFNARVKRINNPRNNSYYDHETGIVVPKRLSQKVILARWAPKRHVSLIGMFVSVLMGVAAVMAARYLGWHYMNATVLDGAGLATDLIVSGLIVMVLGTVFRQNTGRHMLAQILGIVVMTATMHNLVWLFPGEFAQIYTTAWVDAVQSAMPFRSIVLPNVTIVL